MTPEPFEDPRWRSRAVVAALAVGVGIAVYVLSVRVFPYHSLNHDEAVYLQQAAMLLDGRLFLVPPVEGAFRPWFFVEAGDRLYSKYAPVTAATFAAGKLLGSYRFALVGVAAANVALTYGVLAEAFDRRTGLVGAGLLALSPLFLVQSAVFLPYAPTTAWNLLFALAYLRSDRTGDRRWAAVAGVAVGVAFFSRPYTAVLFAAPWIAHAGWTLWTGGRRTWLRQSTTAALGLSGVAVTLGYNAVTTGSPLVFPYEAFAPLDGLGFGHREILAHGIEYTPELAVRSNLAVLSRFVSRWASAGLLGSLLAVVGLVHWTARSRREGIDPRQAALLGVGATVVVGNVYFWGNFNVLGNLAVPDDGLVHYLGPYYHFDLLVPTAALGARGTLALADRYRDLVERRLADRARPVALAGLLLGAAVVGGAGALTAAEPVSDNAAVTDRYRAAYEPLENREYRESVVLLPESYGEWLNHPFQALRNDPGFDGETVYALRGRSLAVAEAYPDRRLYRYTYRGEWSPTEGPPVTPRVQRVRRVTGDRVTVDAALGVPEDVERVSVRVGTEGQGALYAVRRTPDRLPLAVTVAGNGSVSVAGPVERVGDDRATVDGRERLAVDVLLDYGTGAGVTYRIELPLEREDGQVRALSPYLEVCRTARECDGDAAYVPGAVPPGVSMNVSTTAVDANRTRVDGALPDRRDRFGSPGVASRAVSSPEREQPIAERRKPINLGPPKPAAMELTRRDAVAVLAAGGIAAGGGTLALSLDDEEEGLGSHERETLVAVARVVYPSELEGTGEFVETYLDGRAGSDPDYVEGAREAVRTLDESGRSWYDGRFLDLDPATRERLLRELSVDEADPDPEGFPAQQVGYYVVNELLYALYASPTGGRLVGIENPQGHPGGLASYRRGPDE